MRTPRLIVLAAPLGLVALGAALAIAQSPVASSFSATLRGSEEVPPVATDANGMASLWLSDDQTRLAYEIIVHSVREVTSAKLYLAPAGKNGDAIAWLYPQNPPPVENPGETEGVLAQGELTAQSLVGPLKDKGLAELVRELEAGDVYVNVQTKAHPDGEIRGQVHPSGAASH